MTPKDQLLIHASNITGFGARYVVQSLLNALAGITDLKETVVCISSGSGLDCGVLEKAGARVERQRRLLPNAISRAWECLVVHREYQGFQRTLVLGDIPLRGARGQVVFVHQHHLVSPLVNRFCSQSVKFKVMRRVFRRNLPFVKTMVVQTGAMREQMIASYPELQNRVTVISQPVPAGLQPRNNVRRSRSIEGLNLFYPAAGYTHKNHALLKQMDATREASLRAEMIVTLSEAEQEALRLPQSWVRNVGRLDYVACMAAYQETDALFFPSLLESYGLPLVEAMTLGLPVVCSDLAYAHWLCEDQAIYFDPLSASSAWSAIHELQRRLADGWRPDWRKAMDKIPKDWNEVAQQFLAVL